MSVLILPRRFTQQPQQIAAIDSAQWGAAVAILPGIGVSTGGDGRTTTGSVMDSVGTAGRSRTISAEAPLIFDEYTGAWTRPVAPYSFLALYRLKAIPVGTARIIGNHSVTGNLQRGYSFSTNATRFQFVVSRTGIHTVISGGNVSLDMKCDVGVVTPTTVSLYENGVLTAGPTSHGGITAATASLRHGGDNSVVQSTNGARSELFMAAMFPYLLSASDIERLADNPWQIFRAPPRRLWVVGAPAVTGSIGWTEQDDAAAISAVVTASAAIGWAEADDIAAMLATARVDASIGWAEESDTTGFSVEVLVAAGIAWAEEPDMCVLTAEVAAPQTANIAWVEDNDIVSIVMFSTTVGYARAPAGSGYSAHATNNETRPVSGDQARPVSGATQRRAATQRNNR